MHKPFYASGFLYHSASGQILLQHHADSNCVTLTMLCAKGAPGKTPQSVFRRSIQKILGITLDETRILPVYDYENETLGAQFIFYVDIADLPEPTVYRSKHVEWFPLSKLSKLNLTQQTRHDIVVGERVIRAALEQKRGTAHRQSH